MKKIVLFLVIVSCISILFIFGNVESVPFLTSISKDPIIQTKIMIEAWAKMGREDQCIQLMTTANPIDLQSLIFIFLKNISEKDLTLLDSIEKLISSVPNHKDQFQLFLQLLKKWSVKVLSKNEIKMLYMRCKNILDKFIKEENEYLFSLIDLNELIGKALEFRDEYKKNLLDIENKIQSISVIKNRCEAIEYLIYSDIDTGIEENYIRHISMFKKIDIEDQRFVSADSFIEALLCAEEYEFTANILSRSENAIDADSYLKYSSDLYLDYLFKFHGDKLFRDLKEVSEKKQYINLLIRNLNPEKAKQFVSSETDWPLASDWYLYCMGNFLNKRASTRIGLLSVLSIAERIKNESIKSELKIEAAKKLIKAYKDETGYSILKQLSEKILKNKIEIYSGMKSMAEVWLEMNCFSEAERFVERIEDSNEKDFQYLLIAEQYLLHGNLEQAHFIFSKLTSEYAKGYLLSAIGALTICQGRDKEGEEFFEKAFILIKKESKQSNPPIFSFEIALPKILEYYVNAKKGRLFSPILKNQ